jgi:hypothetical protein
MPGHFEPSEQGTRVHVEFHPAITFGRMVFLAAICIALAVVGTVAWIFFGTGVAPTGDAQGLLLGIGALTFLCSLGAGVGIGCIMLTYCVQVRVARVCFRDELIESGASR